MHRNNIVIFRLKLLVLAASLVLCPIASTCGQLVPGSEESDAAKGPDPRLELEAEAKLPGVEPEMRRGAVRIDQTLLNDAPRNSTTQGQPGHPDPFREATERAPATSQLGDGSIFESANTKEMQAELAATKAELAKTKEMVGEMLQEYKQLTEARQLPPLKDAEIKFFTLQNLDAEQAALTVGSLLGHEPVRIATDERTNAVIVVGKAESLAIIEALLLRLDEQAKVAPKEKDPVAATSADAERRTLLLRVFWLANGVEGLDSADGYLPAPVINSLAKLGLADPRLVTQTVNSLSVEEGGSSMEFSTNVPAILFEQPVTLTCAGTMGATTDNRADVDMQLTVGGIGVNCDLKGSLATPLGHFMVLGTANSVIPDFSPQVEARKRALEEARALAQERAMEEARAQEAEEGAMGRGGEMAMRGGGGYRGRGGEMGRGMAMGELPAAKYNASRFAFVVQVIEAESFEPGEEGQ